ncbi:hypothetical protein P7C70_g9596, partial [Phenoliferia sp. Uapishka_3]
MVAMDSGPTVPGQKKKVNWSNIAVGGVMNVSTTFYLLDFIPPVSYPTSQLTLSCPLPITPLLIQCTQYTPPDVRGTFNSLLSPRAHDTRAHPLYFEQVTTLGQPFEVIKTQMASQRGDTMGVALRKVWARGGVLGFYQGLIPWAWIEASTKGAVLLFTAAEIETATTAAGISPAIGGLLGGMGGGVVQAYATMGKSAFFSVILR